MPNSLKLVPVGNGNWDAQVGSRTTRQARDLSKECMKSREMMGTRKFTHLFEDLDPLEVPGLMFGCSDSACRGRSAEYSISKSCHVVEGSDSGRQSLKMKRVNRHEVRF